MEPTRWSSEWSGRLGVRFRVRSNSDFKIVFAASVLTFSVLVQGEAQAGVFACWERHLTELPHLISADRMSGDSCRAQ